MKKFFSHNKDEKGDKPGQFPDAPPSYEQSEDVHNNSSVPSYSGNSGPNEYPEEKKGGPEGQNQPPFPNGGGNQGYGQTQIPPGTYTYTVPPQKVNIAYETDGRNTRPGYAEYVGTDNERIARGEGPLPREAFGSKKGAPLAPSKKSQGSSGGFPGASGPSGPTYFNTSRD